MKNFLIVADQDRGKTYFMKNEILKKFHSRKNYICDVNQEYPEFKNEAHGIFDVDNFLNKVPVGTDLNPSNVNVIYDESTMFFSRAGVTKKSLYANIFRRHHSGNINAFAFHGLDFVPEDILPAIDFFIIFRTSDKLNDLKKKFTTPLGQRLIEAWIDVQQKTEGTKFDRKNKTYIDERSKHFFHYKKIIEK